MNEFHGLINDQMKSEMEHIEKFAAAFLKETGLNPTSVTMCKEMVGSMGWKIYFEPRDNSGIEARLHTANKELRRTIIDLRASLCTLMKCETLQEVGATVQKILSEQEIM